MTHMSHMIDSERSIPRIIKTKPIQKSEAESAKLTKIPARSGLRQCRIAMEINKYIAKLKYITYYIRYVCITYGMYVLHITYMLIMTMKMPIPISVRLRAG